MIAIPYLTALTTYFSYGLLFAFGQVRDFFRKFIDWWSSNNLQVVISSNHHARSYILLLIHSFIHCFGFGAKQGYAPICLGLEDFYVRRLYLRIQVFCN